MKSRLVIVATAASAVVLAAFLLCYPLGRQSTVVTAPKYDEPTQSTRLAQPDIRAQSRMKATTPTWHASFQDSNTGLALPGLALRVDFFDKQGSFLERVNTRASDIGDCTLSELGSQSAAAYSALVQPISLGFSHLPITVPRDAEVASVITSPGYLSLEIAPLESTSNYQLVVVVNPSASSARSQETIRKCRGGRVLFPSSLNTQGEFRLGCEFSACEPGFCTFSGPRILGETRHVALSRGVDRPSFRVRLMREDGRTVASDPVRLELIAPDPDSLTTARKLLVHEYSVVDDVISAWFPPDYRPTLLHCAIVATSESATVAISAAELGSCIDLGTVVLSQPPVAGECRVYDDLGTPISSSRLLLVLRPDGDQASVRLVPPGADGSFTLLALPGKYELCVSGRGYIAQSRSLNLPAAEPIVVQLERGRSVQGTVLLDSDVPLHGVYLEVSDGYTSQTVGLPSSEFLVTTISTHATELRFRFFCAALDWPIATFTLQAANLTTPPTLDLRGRCRALTRCVVKEGVPFSNGAVLVSSGRQMSHVTTDSQGCFSLVLPVEVADFQVSLEEESPKSSPTSITFDTLIWK